MRAVTAHLMLTFVMVVASFADKDFSPITFFMDDFGPSSDLSSASTDSPFANSYEVFENENAPDLSLDLSFVPADSSALDYFQPDEDSEYWHEGLPTLSTDAENPSCHLPARIRARGGTCAASPTIDPPTLFDLSDPNLKLKPICPMDEFPFYLIAVCSSGNPLDEWGPVNSLLLYDSEQGELVYTP